MTLDLATLDGSNGFRLGSAAASSVGNTVAAAGDFNGDGLADLLIGAPGTGSVVQRPGQAFVVFGRREGFGDTLDLAALDDGSGIALGESGARDGFGQVVAGVGDVNGDGLDDILIGAPGVGPEQFVTTGEVYLVFGRAEGFGAPISVAQLPPDQVLTLTGGLDGARTGNAVAGAGDVNGDGLDDFLLRGYATGTTQLIFGARDLAASSLDITQLSPGQGVNYRANLGSSLPPGSIGAAGDVNGDGFDDFLFGFDGNTAYANGQVFVVFGGRNQRQVLFDLITYNVYSYTGTSALNGLNGFRLRTDIGGAGLGYSVAAAGDLNGDGLDDLVVSASRRFVDDAAEGDAIFVVFGTRTVRAEFDVLDLDGGNGFILVQDGDAQLLGRSIASAGDVNGDGIDDLIVSARQPGPGADRALGGVGESYLLFGGREGFARVIDLDTLDPSQGVRLTSPALANGGAPQVTGAGDVNGDGIEDLLIGQPDNPFEGLRAAGESYVVFGSNALGGANDAPVATDDRIVVAAGEIADLAIDNGAGADKDADFDTLVLSTIDGIAVAPGDGVTLASGVRLTFVGGTKLQFDTPGFGPGILSARFSYGVTDGRGGVATAEVEVDVQQPDFDLARLDGSNGFVFRGAQQFELAGTSVAIAGDLDGDGLDDLIIGAPGANNGRYLSGAGMSFVVYGSADGISADLDRSMLGGQRGLRLIGGEFVARSGYDVAGAGDVNGDGLGDLLITAPTSFVDGQGDFGRTYVVFGAAGRATRLIDLNALDSDAGFALVGGRPKTVAGAGDINGDGFDDLLVGNYQADVGRRSAAGEVIVVFGSATPAAPDLATTDLNGRNGFRITGAAGGDYTGKGLAGVGDVNGDGLDDFLIGASKADRDGRQDVGVSYLIFGRETQTGRVLNLANLDPGRGIRITGPEGSYSGSAVTGAVDLNGDGLDDLVIAAPGFQGNGSIYVVFGTRTGLTADLDLATLDGRNGFRIEGATFGVPRITSISNAGDLNGDGVGDLVIGGSPYDGFAYVVFGNRGGFAARFDLAALDGVNGYRIVGPTDQNGFFASFSGGGDINGDGFDDLIIGAPYSDIDGQDRAGQAYVIYGSATVGEMTVRGDARRNALAGQSGDDRLFGLGGDDTLDGGIGNDRLRGGAGSDLLIGGAGADTLLGDSGNDTLSGGAGADSIDGGIGVDLISYAAALAGMRVNLGTGVFRESDGARDRVANVEGVIGTDFADTLIAGARATTLLGGAGRDQIVGGSANDRIEGGSGDDGLIGGGGADTILGGDGDDTIRAGLGANSIDGGAGNDRIVGAQGHEVLRGGAGNDAILGDAGNDTIEGGPGTDQLVGGAGRDVFVFRAGFGVDRVIDFTNQMDRLDFRQHAGVDGFGDLDLTQVATAVLITDGGGGRIVLLNTDFASIDASDFLF